MNHTNSKLIQKPAFYKILVFAIAFLLSTVPVHATSEPGLYFTFTGSMSMYEDMKPTNKDENLPARLTDSGAILATETGLGFDHAIGYQFGNSFGMELEFSYRSADYGEANSDDGESKIDGDMSTKSLLLNGTYYFDIREFYTPYIGYGIGIAFHKANLGSPSTGIDFDEGTDTTPAYQFKMGVDMEFHRKLSLLLGYRYFTTQEPKLGFFDGEHASHGIETGIKFHF